MDFPVCTRCQPLTTQQVDGCFRYSAGALRTCAQHATTPCMGMPLWVSRWASTPTEAIVGELTAQPPCDHVRAAEVILRLWQDAKPNSITQSQQSIDSKDGVTVTELLDTGGTIMPSARWFVSTRHCWTQFSPPATVSQPRAKFKCNIHDSRCQHVTAVQAVVQGQQCGGANINMGGEMDDTDACMGKEWDGKDLIGDRFGKGIELPFRPNETIAKAFAALDEMERQYRHAPAGPARRCLVGPTHEVQWPVVNVRLCVCGCLPFACCMLVCCVCVCIS